VHESAETVEKVQMANSDNFDLDKNQLLTGRRILKKCQIPGFSAGSLFSSNFQGLQKPPYTNYICNSVWKFGGPKYGTIASLLIIRKHPQDVVVFPYWLLPEALFLAFSFRMQ
jgi:hypothetical protein